LGAIHKQEVPLQERTVARKTKLNVQALLVGNWHIKSAAIALNQKYRSDYDERRKKVEVLGANRWPEGSLSETIGCKRAMPGFFSKWQIYNAINPDDPFTGDKAAIERPVIKFIEPPVEAEEATRRALLIGQVKMGESGEKDLESHWLRYTAQVSADEKAHVNVATMQVDMDRSYEELESAFREQIRKWKKLVKGTHDEALGWPPTKKPRKHPHKDKEALIAFWLWRYQGYSHERAIRELWPREARNKKKRVKGLEADETDESSLSASDRHKFLMELDELQAQGLSWDKAQSDLEKKYGLSSPEPKRSKLVKRLYDRLKRAWEIINEYPPQRVDRE
jgi:hypothetical protein